MNMPVQLYALTWSADDTKAIQEWEQENGQSIAVAGWSRILLEPLHIAVSDPNILGLAIDGVVIRDHKTWPADNLKEAIKKLNAQTLALYSVANGVEKVALPNPVQY